MWTCRLFCLYLLTMDLVYGSQESLSDDEIIEGGRNISIFLWGFIFMLLSIVATWYYFNLEDAGEPSAIEEQDKETEVAMRIVHQLTEEETKKSELITSQFSTKAPVRTKSRNLAANVKTNGFEDGETSILCSKYDWEENDGDSEDSDLKDRFRRRSMEEMSLIFPGFLPKITEEEEEEEEESESSGGSEEASESATAQTSDKFNSSPNKSYTPPIGPSQDVNKSPNDFDRLDSSVNTQVSKTEPIPVAKKPGMRSNDTNLNAVVKERENYSQPNTSLGGANVASEPKTRQILQEESFIMCSKSENLSETSDFEIGKNISELNATELRNRHIKDGSCIPVSSQENENFGAKEIISGRLEPRSKTVDLQTSSVISPHMNGYLAENEIVDIEPAIIEPESFHFNNSRAKDVEKTSTFLFKGLPSKLDIFSFDKNTELNDNVKDNLDEPSLEDKIAIQVQDLEIKAQKGDITDCNFNEFTNVLNRGNISDLHEQPVMDENLNNTHAWTFFSMSSEAEKSDDILQKTECVSSLEKVQETKSVPKIVVDSCEELSLEGKIDESGRPAEIAEPKTKQNIDMDPNTFETDIDVDDIDLDDEGQFVEEGEFSMYFKRPVSVTDLDKIIETTGAGKENAESKRAKMRSEAEVDRIVEEITQKKNLPVHIRNNQLQETDLDELDNNSEAEVTEVQTTRSTATKATSNQDQGVIYQNGLLYRGSISGNLAFTKLVDIGESFANKHGPCEDTPNGLDVIDTGSKPGEVSIAIVTLESEIVSDFEAAPDNQSVVPSDSKAKIDLAAEWKSYDNHAPAVDQEEVAPVPGQLGKTFEDLPSQEIVETSAAAVLQDLPCSELPNSQVTAGSVEEAVVVNDIEVIESTPETKHDTLPESVVILENTHPAYESASKKQEYSTDKAVCAESEGHQIHDIKTAEVDYTTEEEEDQTKFSVIRKAKENIEESEATCVTQEECELLDISLDEIDFVSDSESLSFTLETPEIIESDEAIEIEEEFAEYSILNPTRTRSKYLISGITQIPERRSKSFSSKSFLTEDIKSPKIADFSTKVHLEKPSPGSQNMGLRIILTGHAKKGDNTEHAPAATNGVLGSPRYSSEQHDRKTLPVAPTKQCNLSKSTDELHEPRVQEISFGMEETVFRASTKDVEGSPGEGPKSPLSPLHSGDAFELGNSPKTFTAKITMQENLPDRRRIIILNVRKKSPGTARWKSMNDIDQMRSAITDITRELEENALHEDQEDQEPIVQRFRADTPVEIMVPYKDEDIPRSGQAQPLESGYCSPVLREDGRAGALSPPTIGCGIYESRRSPKPSGSVSQRTTSPLSPHYRKMQETIFAISAEPLSEMMIPKRHEDMVTTTGRKPEVGGIVQETDIYVDSEPTPSNIEPKSSKSVDVHIPEQNISARLKKPSSPPVHVRMQERVTRETTFPVYSKPVSEINKPEHEKSRSIFSPQPNDVMVSPPLAQRQKHESKRTTDTVFTLNAEPRQTPVQLDIAANEGKKSLSASDGSWETRQNVSRSLSPVVVERKVHEIKGQKETVFVVSAEPQSGAMLKNKTSKERRDVEGRKAVNATTKKDSSVFGVFAKPKTVKAAPVGREKAVSPAEEITIQAVAISKRTSTAVLAKEIKKTEKTTHVTARLDPASEAIVNVFSDEEDNARSPYRHGMQGKPVEPVMDTVDASKAPVIHAFPVNYGYDDEELDDVFIEYGPPLGYQTKQPPSDSRISPLSVASQQRTTMSSVDRELGSYDADSETSSIQGQLTPQRVRHRHTKASLLAASGNGRLSESDTDESSSTPTNITPTAFQQEGSAASDFEPYSQVQANSAADSRFPKEDDVITAAVMVGARSDNPQYYEAVGLIEEQVTDESTEEEMCSLKLRKISENELPFFTGSAFKPVNGTEKLAVKRPLPRSDVFVPRERSASAEEALLLAGQIYGKNIEDKPLSTDWENIQGLRDMDSGKSMPNLHKQEEMTTSPNVSKLSSHTRMWLSQNTGIDFDGEDMMTSELFLYPSSRLDLTMQDDMSDTLSTRPQTPMSEFSYAGETPYAGLRRDSRTVISCANSYCCKEEVLYGLEKTSFTSCPACFTYYCSGDCRRINWREHKKICFFGRINSYIRSFVYYCNRKEELRLHLSKIAKSGFKKKGRGCIMVMFASPQLARNFMTTGCKVFPSPPSYSALSELKAEGVITKHRVSMLQSLEDYDPHTELVLNLAILAGKMENSPDTPMPRHKLNTVLHCVRISLSNTVVPSSPAPSSDTTTETKVFRLPKCARHEFVDDVEARRHYCRNISKSLKQYGIRLKHDYPDVYEKMCLYVEKSVDFEPQTVYGNKESKLVLCKIMPETGDTKSQKK